MKRNTIIPKLAHIRLYPVEAVVVALIFLWGLALRAVELLNGNYLFGHDMGRDFLLARTMVLTHKLTLIGNEVGSGSAGINGIFHGPGYLYVVTLAYMLFGGDPYGGIVLMFLFGAVALGLNYFLTRTMYGRPHAAVALFLTAVSPLIVSQSRFVWSSHIATPIIIAALYFVFRIPDKPKVYAPLAMFFCAMTYQSQLGVAVPMVAAFVFALPVIYRIRSVRVYLSVFGALILGFLPMIIFETRHGFMALKGIVAYVAGGGGSSWQAYLSRLVAHAPFYYSNFTNTFTFEFGMLPGWFQTATVVLFLPFVLWYAITVTDVKKRRFHWFLLTMTVITFVGYMFLDNVVWDYYLMHLRMGYIFLYSYATGEILRAWKKRTYLLPALVAAVFLVTLGTGTAYRMYISYTVDYFDKGGYEKIAGKRAAIDAIYTDAAGKPFSVFEFVPYIYTYPYDYLFATYGQKTYGYQPGTDKQGLVYLLIEPDTDKPWRHKGWLETVVNGGVVVSERTLPGGQILIKKSFPENRNQQ